MKEEKGSLKGEIILPCPLKDTCTVYVQEEELNKEEIKEENVFAEKDICTVYIKEEDDEMDNTEKTGNEYSLIYLKRNFLGILLNFYYNSIIKCIFKAK